MASMNDPLRAAKDLWATVWAARKETEDARCLALQIVDGLRETGLLAPVYSWFTEGFDTKDLKEAKTLLQELS